MAGESATATPLSCRERPYWPTVAWQHRDPSPAHLDTTALGTVARLVADSMPNIRAYLVVQGGYIVSEGYWGGADSSTPQDIRSVTKVVTSSVVGQALGNGTLRGLDERIYDFFPEYYKNQDPTSLKWRIQVRHLLTMTSGLQWDEERGFGAGMIVADTMWLTPPMATRPGTTWKYSSASPHILSIALRRVTGRPLSELANAGVFTPIGTPVAPSSWPTDAAGNSWGGSGLKLTARQMASLGYLYLNDGCWSDRRVLPAGWVEDATEPHVELPNGKDEYGYYWWRTTIGGHPGYLASGYGGQHIIVIPTLDLVVVTAATPGPVTPTTDPMTLVHRTIIPVAAPR